MAIKFNRNFNVGRVISRLVTGVLSLYVGGTILTEFGSVMNQTQSPLYSGLTLIGWTVNSDDWITATNGSGVLSVIGILVIAQIIMEFINF